MTLRVAVIGAGIAGISAAYRLRADADVTLFESADRAGGHAHTVEVDRNGNTFGLDTAFIVYNEPHYPSIAGFFAELGVSTKAHPGRFSFFDADTSRAYVSEDFDLSEDEVVARYPAEFVRLWREAARFHRDSPRDFMRGRTEVPLAEYLDRNGYSESFRYGFIVLIATAAWSVPAERIWQMPASTVIAFFFAHGVEGLGGRTVPWRTVAGGSVTYVRAALDSLRAANGEVRLGTEVLGVRAEPDAVAVRTVHSVERFDHVVLATHADEALRLLDRPTPRQRMLEAIAYHPTRAVLHTDPAVMPANTADWRSWNYGRTRHRDEYASWVVYYLNHLQDFRCDTDFFVTLDCPLRIREDRVIADIRYRHPVFTAEVRRLQREIHTVNEDSRVKFAGSYFHARKLGPDIVGSHESAFDSGRAAAESLLRDLGRV
ncbi:NAD(P)/FAD-dependent oxidoreductase [Actinocrispum wychmicini]|uniref:Putative NAD/FAD-binding protein n=1 Tax=Actinocrispum wychmicini TaxID=1213861 RepID=A0A4R2K2U5_9PSEU|nr:FAD-dependent oxidoreductase [Actinocrispum wychmicini]TCO60625.1 putative NAD/FAD-binding protein [Actinocrispum wychmicini]